MMTLDRSGLLFIYDAQDCNPNGNPVGDNRPRRDPDTGQGIITDVRPRRYLQDQFQGDGFNIYVKKTEGRSHTRTKLIEDVLDGVDGADGLEDLGDVTEAFLDTVTNIRYFGSTLSFEASDRDEDEAFRDALNSSLPSNYQGSVQFLPSKSLNEVEENEEYDSLTSVISTGEGNRQGGFDLDDKHIKYGIFPFWELIDNNGTESTNLSQADVERLDMLCWRAPKNQTTSRSKLGQEPRLYVHVEYEEGNYHVGGLQNLPELGDDNSESSRSVKDVAVDVTGLVETLECVADWIDTFHVVGGGRLELDIGDETIRADEFWSRLSEAGHDVREMDVLNERDLA